MERITLNPEKETMEKIEAAPITLQGTVTAEEAIKSTENATIPIISQENNIQGAASPLQASTASVSAGNLVDGKIEIDLVDAVLPSLLVLLFHAVGMKIKKTDLQLTEREKGTLAPLLQKCLDGLMINFGNPWAALGISAGIIYGSKILEKGGVAFLDSKMKQEEKKPFYEQKETTNQKPESKSPIEVIKELSGNSDFSEEKISLFMRERRVGREKAIAQMKNLRHKGKLPAKFQ